MSVPATGVTPRWATLRLLLGAARQRSWNRGERQRRLAAQKGGGFGDWASVGSFILLLFGIWLHAAVAGLLFDVVGASHQEHAEAHGLMVVSQRCLEALERFEREGQAGLPVVFRGEGRSSGERDRAAYEARLLAHYERHGRAGLEKRLADDEALDRHRELLRGPATLLGSLIIVGWFVTLALQGEGVDLDLQRRRHPMWEWLLGHPVDPRAVFLAEMLSPLAANVAFWPAPIFWVRAFWIAYDDFGVALVAGLAAGLPLCVAAGCVGKAIEIVAVLRLPPRSRGATLGVLSWIGQTMLLLLVLAAFTVEAPLAATRLAARATGSTGLPLFEWALGLQGTPSPWNGVLACWACAAILIGLATQFSAHATRQGLAGAFGGNPDAPVVLADGRSPSLMKDPVYRKELLWLWRDRGALVQVFLIPLSLVAIQLINLRSLVIEATHGWHLMAGAAVMFGSYFLFILAPRSLLSEGAALWLSLTWPRGLEELLKAKARLCWAVSLVVVAPLLLVTALRFPAEAWKVALVGVLWVAFGRSLAEKGVTLVSAPSSAGEPEPVPRGRRWAASLGTLTFAAGILTLQWHVALMGVVYSWLTAAAMWQNFRARLPYLFDPWSERAPPAPTLMHAMVAISGMTEAMAIAFALLLALFGQDAAFIARSVAYGVCGLGAWRVTSGWLEDRGAYASAIWHWADAPPQAGRMAQASAIGLALGLALGAAGAGYSVVLQQLPELGESLRAASAHLAAHPAERGWMALMAVGFAPLAEEYLFRGLLFRALDREWGGARAIWGSACFFAIYHPPEAWLPVVLVGATSALLFKRLGHLRPCVLLHMAYNAVVVWVA